MHEEQELFREYRRALIARDTKKAKEIVIEYGRRGYKTMNGVDIEVVFKRNPAVEHLYNMGKNEK